MGRALAEMLARLTYAWGPILAPVEEFGARGGDVSAQLSP